MKKSVVLLVSAMFVLGCALMVTAQTAKQPVHKTFSGTVDKVTAADATTGTMAEVVVKGSANNSMTFVVVAACTFYDAKGGTITLDKIVAGSSVKVTYTTNAQGGQEAISIKLLK